MGQWDNLGRYIFQGGSAIADALKQKWMLEAQKKQYEDAQRQFLYQNDATAPVNPASPNAVGGMRPDGSQTDYQSPMRMRENPFDQSNIANLLNFARQPGGQQMLQTLLALQDKETPINQEGGGFGVYRKRIGEKGTYEEVKPPLPKALTPQYANSMAEALALSNDPRVSPQERAANRAVYDELVRNEQSMTKLRGAVNINVGQALGKDTSTGKATVMINGKPTEMAYTQNKNTGQLELSPIGEAKPNATQMRLTESGRKSRDLAKTMLSQLDKVEALYKKNNQGERWVGGALSSASRLVPGDIGGALKEATGKISKEEQQFRVLANQIFGESGFQRAGAAFTQNELNVLRSYIPSTKMANKQFEASIPEFREVLKAIANAREQGAEITEENWRQFTQRGQVNLTSPSQDTRPPLDSFRK